MSAVAPTMQGFPARLPPGPAGRGVRPPLPARLGASLSSGALAVMAEGLASVVTAESVPLPPGGSRNYAKLLATADYDVWLIAWAPTGTLDLHDHGGSTGVARVVEGQLVETYTDLADRHRLRSVTVDAGRTVTLPATRVHEVWNPGPAPALSVHIYSPPLTTMTFFDHRPEHFLEPLRTEYGDLCG